MSEESYKSFLEVEVDRMSRSARTTWIGGAIVVVALVAYMSFILTMVKAFTEPENAALLVADNVKSNFPSFIETAEVLMAERSIVLAEQSSESFLAAVPSLRAEAEAQLDYAHTEMIPHVSIEFQDILTGYIGQHREEIRTLAADGADKAFTDAFVTEVMDEFGLYLNDSLADSFNGRDLYFVKENSLIALQAMDEYLGELIAADPASLGRKEALQRKILATLAQRVSSE